MSSKSPNPKRKSITARLAYDGKPDGKEPLAAYVFNRKGELQEKVTVENDEIRFNTDAREILNGRLLIAPLNPEKKEQDKEGVSIRSLKAHMAYEPALSLKDNELILKPIPEFYWDNWCWRSCRVRGRVVKPIFVDGESVDMPVCHARVHVCEVDRLALILPEIPDLEIIDIRDFILDFPPKPVPIPEPLPGPFPGPFPFSRMEGSQPKVARKSVLKPLSKDLKEAFRTDSPLQLRKVLLENFRVLHPYLCLEARFWPYFYSCEELLVLDTDGQGRFDGTIWYNCFGDHPDLYFWVEYSIGDEWTTVYKPPKPCNTYWDYECGSEVTLRVTDPRVDVCGGLDVPAGNSSVEIIKVGDRGYVSHIEQSFWATEMVQGAALRSAGLTNLNGNGPKIRPFGGSLGFRVKFGSAFPGFDNITHYRWSYRKIATGELNGVGAQPWRVIDTPVSIKYYEEVGNNFHKKAYPLGPDPAMGETAFKIPPQFASDIDVPNPDNRVRSWALEEWNSAILNTLFSGVQEIQRREDAGLYQFKFELLKQVGGNLAVADLPRENFQIPMEDLDPYQTEDAPDNHLFLVPGGKASGFTMRLRIDNNLCKADIKPAVVDGNAANECGFGEYNNRATDEVKLSFLAYHPNNLATLSYRVRKGTQTNAAGNPVYVESTGGMLHTNTPQGYNRNVASVFEKDVAVSDLLGTCPTEAAFGEYLRVDALATNGSSTELGYDAASLAGFAIKRSAE